MVDYKILQKRKVIFLLALQYFILSHIFILNAQDKLIKKVPFPKLTTEQMFLDFDYFIETVETISPQTPVRKSVTGIDPSTELQKMRTHIPKIKSSKEFATLIQSAITVLQDGHSSLLWPRGYPSEELKEWGVSEEAISLFPSYYELRKSKSNKKKFNMKLTYINGEYYNIEPFDYKEKHFESGLKLSKINGQKASDFVHDLFPYLTRMRWDYKYKRYYSERFFRAINLTAEQNLDLTFTDKYGKEISEKFILSDKLQYTTSNNDSKKIKKVVYFSDTQTLYIRIPRMNLDHIAFYPQEIRSKAQGKSIKKIIIDIRDNPGGTDNVWTHVLSAIIKDPIDFELLLLAVPSNKMKKTYAKDSPNWKSYEAPFLNDYKYAVFASGPRQIKPATNSLNFSGNIYLLQNENIYSSSGAFAAVGMLADNIQTVGQNTGWLLGRGVNPLVFELPNSKILYRLEPVIDFQNVKSARDVYHDEVEIPVSLTIEQYLKRIHFEGDIYGREFLFNHDPVFLKALND